ncbi:MAG: hypothetical protein Q9159_007504 [Coniocarpon cinnabarinum]
MKNYCNGSEHRDRLATSEVPIANFLANAENRIHHPTSDSCSLNTLDSSAYLYDAGRQQHVENHETSTDPVSAFWDNVHHHNWLQEYINPSQHLDPSAFAADPYGSSSAALPNQSKGASAHMLEEIPWAARDRTTPLSILHEQSWSLASSAQQSGHNDATSEFANASSFALPQCEPVSNQKQQDTNTLSRWLYQLPDAADYHQKTYPARQQSLEQHRKWQVQHGWTSLNQAMGGPSPSDSRLSTSSPAPALPPYSYDMSPTPLFWNQPSSPGLPSSANLSLYQPMAFSQLEGPDTTQPAQIASGFSYDASSLGHPDPTILDTDKASILKDDPGANAKDHDGLPKSLPSGASRADQDRFLKMARALNPPMLYKEIAQRIHFKGSPETLRTRRRNMVLPKEERPRRPLWSSKDDKLLCRSVETHHVRQRNGHGGPRKIPWEAIGLAIKEGGGSRRFSGKSCSTRYKKLCSQKRDEESVPSAHQYDIDDLETLTTENLGTGF